MVKEIENDRSLDLQGYSVHLQKDMQKFRKYLTFRHDQLNGLISLVRNLRLRFAVP